MSNRVVAVAAITAIGAFAVLVEAARAELGLVVTVLHGRPGTAMPPWRTFVNEVEAAWIVKQLQEGTLRER